MTQRVELATVMDRLAVDEVITRYALALGDGDWEAFRGVFAKGAWLDYLSTGGIEGDVEQVVAWLREETAAARRHLLVNRLTDFAALEHDTGDTARVRADYTSPGGRGGRYDVALVRTAPGWRIGRIAVRQEWRAAPSSG